MTRSARFAALSVGAGLLFAPARVGAAILLAAGTGAGTADPASISAVPDLPDFSGAIIRMLLIVGTLCVALFVAIWWIRRRVGSIGSTGRSMRLVETLRVAPGREILLVDVAGSYLIVGVTPTSMTTLSSEPLDREALTARLGDRAVDAGSRSSGVTPSSGAEFRGTMGSRGGAVRGPIDDEAASFASVFHGIPAAGSQAVRAEGAGGGGS